VAPVVVEDMVFLNQQLVRKMNLGVKHLHFLQLIPEAVVSKENLGHPLVMVEAVLLLVDEAVNLRQTNTQPQTEMSMADRVWMLAAAVVVVPVVLQGLMGL
jgi:hypothetical protein